MNKTIALIIVNTITFTRILGTFLMPVVTKEFTVYAILIYLSLLFLTDTLDGILARKLKVSSIFGAILDATADKLFGVAYLCLIGNKYPVLFLPVIVEIIIIINNLIGAINGATLESTKLGKYKTWIFGILTILAFIVCYIDELTIFNSIDIIVNNKEYLMGLISGIMTGLDCIVAFNYYLKVKTEIEKAKINNIRKSNYKLKRGKELIYALFDYNYYINTLKEPLLIRLGDNYEK